MVTNFTEGTIMSDSNQTGDMVHVSDYTRGDGVQVDDYYRAKPGCGSISENNGSTNNSPIVNTVSEVMKNAGIEGSIEKECPALAELFGSVDNNQAAEADSPPEVILEGGIEVVRIILEGVIKVAQVIIEAISVILPIAIALYEVYQEAKTIYNGVASLFSHPQNQTYVKKLNTGIKGLKESQGIQKKYLSLLAQKAANAKNQGEYSKLMAELAKQKAQYENSQKLIGKIEYSAGQQDYASVLDGLKEYQNSANTTIDDMESSYTNKNADANADWMNSKNQQLEDALNSAFSQPAYADEYKSNVQSNSNNPAQNPQQVNTDNTNSTDGFKTLKAGISKTVEQAQTLIKPIIKKAVNGPVLDVLETKDGKMAMDIANYLLNIGAKDAADLMQISIYGPENLEPTSEYMPTDKSFNNKLNGELGLSKLNIEIPKDWYGVVFDKNSHIAQTLNNTSKLKKLFSIELNGKTSKEYFSITFEGTDNLTKSIHGGTILNPKDNGSYYSGIFYDNYDFKYMKIFERTQTKLGLKIANDIAYLLQQTKILHNYYLLIPINIAK